MDKDDFKASAAGTLIPSPSGQLAFMPDALPPKLNYQTFAIELAEAMEAIGRLNAAGRNLANPNLIIRPLLRKEALLSSSMEGTYTTANALVLAESDANIKSDRDTIEVRNYIGAFNVANNLRKTLPLAGRLFRETHKTLLADVSSNRGASARPGEYKNQQNFIGGKTRRIEDARFVPPPPLETVQAMDELEAFLNADSSIIPPIISAGLFHYQFETIHPFGDGNGRIGRLLIPIFLLENGLLEQPLLYVSPSVEGLKDEYVDLMLEVSKSGAWDAWLKFFLQIIKKSCYSILCTINELETLRNDFHQKLIDSGSPARYLPLIDELFVNPVVWIPKAQSTLETTYPTAKNAIDRLVRLGIIMEIKNTTHPKLFVSWQIVNLSEGD